MPTVRTASTAASTLPGPIGSPAARSVRAKYIRLARRWPDINGDPTSIAGRGELRLDLGEQAQRLAALDLPDVVLVFQQHAERVVDRVRGQRQHVELHQGLSPVDRLGDARQFEEIGRAQLLHEGDDLAAELFRRARRLDLEDLELALGVGIVDPVVETAPFQRVMDLARAVRGDHDDRRLLRLDRSDPRDGDLEMGEDLEQIGLERLVGAVELVDEEPRRAAERRLERLQQGTLDQEALREDLLLDAVAPLLTRLGEADLDHLARIVPFINGRGDVEPLIALQADKLPPERSRQHLGDLGLPDPRLPLEKQRPPELEGEIDRRRQAAIRDVIAGPEQFEGGADGGGDGGG